jgi:hypothetical protein
MRCRVTDVINVSSSSTAAEQGVQNTARLALCRCDPLTAFLKCAGETWLLIHIHTPEFVTDNRDLFRQLFNQKVMHEVLLGQGSLSEIKFK